MIRFLIRRILQGILVLWLITVGVFGIFFIGPGAKAGAPGPGGQGRHARRSWPR